MLLQIFLYFLLFTTRVCRAAIGDTCRSSQGTGTCKDQSSCSNGFTVKGACPSDPANILCCIQASCKDNDGVQGTCLDKSRVGCDGGFFEAGFCPGPPNIQCCLRSSCRNKQGTAGTCLDKSLVSCAGGHFEAGFCPGPTNIQCCIQNTNCPTYWVIGVRGSGEALTGANEIEKMGATVGAYIKHAAENLPAGTEYLSLPYPAAPVGLDYFQSEEPGWQGLQAVIRTRVGNCPNIKIGIVGYSQGAHVVNDALNYLSRNAASSLNNVRAILQIADPRADPNQSYHVGITSRGLPAPSKQHGGILTPQALPEQVRQRATSICISTDSVCDAPDNGLALLAQAVNLPIHGAYKDCCVEFFFPQILGAGLANRLKG